MSNRLDPQYKELIDHILHFGVDKSDRTGTGTKSVFGWQIRHRMSEGFPLLTTKKMARKTMVTELLWFLRGDTNIKFLVDNDCHIWDGDAWANYSKKIIANNLHLMPASDLPKTKEEFINKIKTDNEFAKKWGELGPIYGRQWRSWESYKNYDVTRYQVKQIDQIANLISELKTNPDSRRLMVSAWAVHDLPNMILPPCHHGFQVYTRELSDEEQQEIYEKRFAFTEIPEEKGWDYKYPVPKRAISLMWNQRSVDVGLGLPFNIASYGLLLEIIAKQVNMVPEDLIGNLGDCHIYNNHIEGLKEQITRTSFDLPKLKILDSITYDDDIAYYEIDDFVIENYQSHPSIKLPLSN